MHDPTKSEISDWWASNPMTYGTIHGKTSYATDESRVTAALSTPEFFALADQRLYEWNLPLHNQEGKFARIFPYARHKGKSVLEIGCGMGCMAMNWAQHGACVTAVDLNPLAIAQTQRRFELSGLPGQIKKMDGENLDFPDASFDYVFSWGVLHHSPHLKKALKEIHRVLRPGGSTGIMLYNRDSLLYQYGVRWLEGILHAENSFLTPLALASRYGDGAREEGNPYTWPVTKQEVYKELFTDFSSIKVTTLGTDIEYVLDLAFPRLGSWVIPKFLQSALGRRWGWSLWITGTKS